MGGTQICLTCKILENAHISGYGRHILLNGCGFSGSTFPSHQNWSTNVILNVDTKVSSGTDRLFRVNEKILITQICFLFLRIVKYR